MIKPEELRIGNYLLEPVLGIVRVFEILNECAIVEAKSLEDGKKVKKYYTINYSQLSPIPLSEEWLLRLGFEKIKESNSYYFEKKYQDLLFVSNDTYFNDGKDEWFIGVGLDCESLWLNNKINTVDKLQNLYYIITGEELTLKE